MTSISDTQPNDCAAGLPPGSPLQACPHCEALLDTTEREPLEVVACPGCGEQLQISGQLDHFEIVAEAGRGGMGVVYRAYDASLDRYVAIKLLRKDHSSDTRLIEQLEYEAAITASINDPNVVRLYATGRDRGRFFLAMELVDKGSLDDLIRLQGRVAEAQVLTVGIQIAKGLRAAHQHGLIHRDVKPGNILFADANTAKIVDFGLAIFMEDEASVRGEVWGTPYYVAPEKLDQQPEDFRSDMYSLGATLFHALAGRPPFEAESASLVALKHLKNQPVSLQAFAPWVSNATAHIINRTLHKNPDERYASYDDLIDNLEYALEELHRAGDAPHQRNRVVLETEEDNKTWSWVVLGTLAAIAVLFVGFFAMRKKVHTEIAQQTKAAKAEATAAPAQFASLAKEIDALAARDPEAPALLRAAATDTKCPPTDRAWAQLLEGAALLSAGKGMDARRAFGQVEPLTKRMKDEKLGAFLRTLVEPLQQTNPLTTADAKDFKRHTHEAIALLLYGLHDWHLGKIEEGTALLREFRSAKPEGSAAWLGQLKPLANSYVEQVMVFQMQTEKFRAAQKPADRFAAAQALRTLTGPMAARVEEIIAPYAKEIADAQAALERPPVAGLYRILNRNSSRGLDVIGHSTANQGGVHQWGFGEAHNQQWRVIPLEGGLYKILASHSGKALDVSNARTDDDAPIVQHEENGAPAQQWRIEPQGGGWFKLRAECSGKYLTVRDAATENSAALHQTADKGTPEQLWRFDLLGTMVGNTGWVSSDLGDVPVAGKAEAGRDSFTITSQSADIWGNADAFHFVHRTMRGDFEFIARVAELKGPHEWTKAGLMVRSTLAENSRNICAVLALQTGNSHQRRPQGGQPTTSDKLPGATAPGWLRLVRQGQRVTTYASKDGQQWQQLGADDIDGPGGFLSVGLAVTSHDPAKPATAKFDHVRLAPLAESALARNP